MKNHIFCILLVVFSSHLRSCYSIRNNSNWASADEKIQKLKALRLSHQEEIGLEESVKAKNEEFYKEMFSASGNHINSYLHPIETLSGPEASSQRIKLLKKGLKIACLEQEIKVLDPDTPYFKFYTEIFKPEYIELGIHPLTDIDQIKNICSREKGRINNLSEKQKYEALELLDMKVNRGIVNENEYKKECNKFIENYFARHYEPLVQDELLQSRCQELIKVVSDFDQVLKVTTMHKNYIGSRTVDYGSHYVTYAMYQSSWKSRPQAAVIPSFSDIEKNIMESKNLNEIEKSLILAFSKHRESLHRSTPELYITSKINPAINFYENEIAQMTKKVEGVE